MGCFLNILAYLLMFLLAVGTRFKAPLPPAKWKGVYKAVDEMYQCPQNSPFGVIGTEDCLKINVYVPVKAKGPLPVMAYVHGGAFVIGNGGKMVVGPEFLVKHDVILVSFNYRLGALGFLCLGIKEAPGNAGLKDQVAALRWINKNIAAFGGDPDSVTIFGTSSGATSVSLLLASEATNGLFKQAIMHSGSSLANWAVNYDPVSVASKIVSRFGYDTKEPKELYEIYSKLSYKELVLATAQVPVSQLLHNYLLHLPCVEKNFPGVESILTDVPYNLLTTKPKNIPLMYSSTDKEGLFFADEETEESLEFHNKRSLFREDLVFRSKKEEKEIARIIKEYYFGKEDVRKTTLMKLSNLYTHLYFEIPLILEAELMTRTIDGPVYSYYLTYSGQRNLIKSRTKFMNETGACHADDLLYIFKGIIWPFKISDKDQIIIDWMTKMLTNFAKYGNPTPNHLPIKWVPHNKDQLNFLKIDEELKMVPVPNPDAYQFWKDIYKKYRRTKAPLPPPKWKGVYIAVDEMYQCPQNSPFGVIGTEDCLKINVYVPAKAKGPLPVMAYVHGGAFVMGNGGKMVVGPEFLVKHDVILVSFNYRLGALGFLCLGIKEAPGNAGLKDQVAALRWINKNIAAFGGDPDSVTIFGTSAGGTSVSLLLASEATNGLFKQAIIHSGSSLANWAVNYDPVSVASKIVSRFGYDTKEPKELYEIYSKLSYKELVLGTAQVPLSQLLHNHLLQLPCVEKSFPGVESVLTNLPHNLLTTKPKNIPLMYSSTDKEGFVFVDEETEESLEFHNKRSLFGEDLVFRSKKEEKEIARKVKGYYFGREDVSKKTLMKLMNLYTHLYFEIPAILEAELMTHIIDAPVYSYYFTYSGRRNLVKTTTRFKNETGACHGDDLLYIFKGIIWPFKISDKDKIIIDWMTKMLTNFAKYGDPTPNNLPVRWVPHSKDQLNFLKIDEELKMVPVPNPDAYQFWKDIYTKYRRTKVY